MKANCPGGGQLNFVSAFVSLAKDWNIGSAIE